MLKIKKLYTEPEMINPVVFEEGLNLILGEKDESSNKTNGVGKSLCIEFINFALLKQASESRVKKIPKAIFSPQTNICLDIIVGNEQITIKRSLQNAERPTFYLKQRSIEFQKLEDATSYLGKKLFGNNDRNSPRFRSMMGPLIRDERSEFKSLVACYDTNKRIPDDYAPYLYLLGINIEIYTTIKLVINEIDELTKHIKKIKDDVELLRQKDIDDARSDMNELESEVKEISRSIDALENISGYEFVKDDIIHLEKTLDDLRREKSILRSKYLRSKPIVDASKIDSCEIREFYEQMRKGLGDQIKRELDEVYEFKKKIDDFQNQLIYQRRDEIRKKIGTIDSQLDVLDEKYKEKLSVLDQQGDLKNLKQTYSAHQSKFDEASQLKAFISKYDEFELQKQRAKTKKEQELLNLQSAIQESNGTLDSLEETILGTHEYIQGNRKASFEVKPTSKKQVVEITMRIDDDGSHSVEREKVFIYDICLLLNDQTSASHPGFLIHDNIFDVDQDTLTKSLDYLVNKARFGRNKQYILTLNADRLENTIVDSELLDLLKPAVRATFTKAEGRRFLKTKYQEILK
jgi:uncharacterized protein YydD (DUF2326 family)